jgi:hypothetical protein
VDGQPDITADNWSGGIAFDGGATEEKNRATAAFSFPPIIEQTAEEAYPLVLASAGASLARDVIDTRIIHEVSSGTTTFGNDGLIDTPSDVGGWPGYNSEKAPGDKDRDGMSDVWEIRNGLNPQKSSDRNGYDLSTDYTNLEVYLYTIISDAEALVTEANNH